MTKADTLRYIKAMPDKYRAALVVGMKQLTPINRLRYVRKFIEVDKQRRTNT